jgi:hypothetical protein
MQMAQGLAPSRRAIGLKTAEIAKRTGNIALFHARMMTLAWWARVGGTKYTQAQLQSTVSELRLYCN